MSLPESVGRPSQFANGDDGSVAVIVEEGVLADRAGELFAVRCDLLDFELVDVTEFDDLDGAGLVGFEDGEDVG